MSSTDPHWTCPTCQKEYEAPPKWCPCTPYPMDAPHVIYAGIHIDAARNTAKNWAKWFMDDGQGGMSPSITTLMQSIEPVPWISCNIISDENGWDMATLLGIEDDLEMHEELMKKRSVRAVPWPLSASKSPVEFILVKEEFRPGVETLDYNGWSVIDMSKDEFEKVCNCREE